MNIKRVVVSGYQGMDYLLAELNTELCAMRITREQIINIEQDLVQGENVLRAYYFAAEA